MRVDRRTLLLPLFFASGASGLIYEVVWVRTFGNLFGNTVYSASLVTSIFMVGLGLGAWLAGRVADRRHARDPRWGMRAYGAVELLIAVLGVLTALILPQLEPIGASLSGYVRGADGWFRPALGGALFRYALAIVLLAPLTSLMGSTLILLIRFLVSESAGEAGRRVAALYGINTVGAALGAALVDLALIPRLGLLGAQLVAVAINVAAGLGALWLARGAPESRRAEEASAAPGEEGDPRGRRLAGIASAALLLSGFAAMGMEILWFRQLSAVLRAQRNVFSVLLAVVLLGIGLGSLIGSYLVRRTGAPARLWAGAQASFAVLSLLFLGTVQPLDLLTADAELRTILPPQAVWAWFGWEALLILGPILHVVFLPSVAMGLSFPLANAFAQSVLARVGRRAGVLYSANTLGAVLGASLTGFALIPWVGVQGSAQALAAVSLGAVLCLALRSTGEAKRLSSAMALVVVAIALFHVLLPPERLAREALPERSSSETILAVREGVNETILVTERPGAHRRLVTNGHSMSATARAGQRYMRLLAHLPLLESENAQDVLVICFGVGNTLDAVLQHPVRRVELVDLSEDVLREAHWFEATNHGALSNPRVQVYVNDGRQHLRVQPHEAYDVITLEPPPLSNAGVASLYSVEFYQLAASRLRAEGLITQWLPIYQLREDVALSVVRAFLDVFPSAVLVSGSVNELILMGRKDGPIAVHPDRWRARLEANPRVASDLTNVDVNGVVELLGTFAGSAATLDRATSGVRPITDDLPRLEHETVLFSPRRRAPAELFDVAGFVTFCPSCYRDGELRSDLVGLSGYLEIQGLLYRSDAFLEPIPQRGLGPARQSFLVPLTETASLALSMSAYLRRLTHSRTVPVPEG
ncbi:MAG: fused MFS/spermidine synthase [Deltaproteobacteria bacterium]|nr:fused MFS/spermidine synthase [Deltaproteobacteria bacterium]